KQALQLINDELSLIICDCGLEYDDELGRQWRGRKTDSDIDRNAETNKARSRVVAIRTCLYGTRNSFERPSARNLVGNNIKSYLDTLLL
ncbi:hypothetical protein HHI36_014160, partial [Cryptolaemus montrouzieri]